MRKYEIMYILDASLSDEDRNALITKLHDIITSDEGKIIDVNEWGVREFAYPINNMTKGYYIVITIEAKSETIREFDRIFRIEGDCIRNLAVKLDEEG